MTNWILSMIDALGPVGVAILIALENIVPPIPSEVVLPLAGYRSRSGAMNPVLVWIAATVGSLAGAYVLYALGAWLGYDRLHRLAGHKWFFVISQDDLERGQGLFERHGSWIVAVSRCIPVIRSVVSIPAGICGMPLVRFSVLTVIGSGIWNAVFVVAGWILADRWQQVDRFIGPASLVIIGGIVVGMGVLAWRRHRSGSAEPARG